jgi:4-amino-4-deoxy-L-arabinose transferase-like glycosyltransferase
MAESGMGLRNSVVLAGILAIAALFRFQDLQQPLIDAFSWREASTAMMADNFMNRSWNIFFPEVSWTGPEPAYQGRELQIVSYVTALLYTVFGWQDWLGRLVAIAFGLWGVFAFHRLLDRVWDTAHAHAGALMLAIMPGAALIDRSFLPDPAMLALVITGAWLYVAYLQEDRRSLLVLAGVITTLGVLAKPPGIAVVIPMTYATFLILRKRELLSLRRLFEILPVALVAGALILAYYRWAIYLGTNYPPYHIAGSGYLWDKGFSEFWNQSFYFPAAWPVIKNWLITPPILILAGIGLMVSPQGAAEPDQHKAPWFFHVWFLAATLIYFLAAREISTNPWNFHIFSVPVAASAGRGLILLITIGGTHGRLSQGLRLAAVLAVVIIGGSNPGLQLMKRPYALPDHQLGAQLSTLSKPGDLVVTATATIGDPIAIYYSRRRGWVFPPGGGIADWSVLPEDPQAIEILEGLRAKNAAWFGIAKKARDSKWQMLVDHNKGLIAHLDKTATRVVDDDNVLIYRLSPPTTADGGDR